ncbi:MAG: hypothetical protein GF368_00570 [Candidatus Aenigmarchaeota archaeon]|nr:hypothetical protein [Candidatus Aenigmarchaeota archaeon]
MGTLPTLRGLTDSHKIREQLYRTLHQYLDMAEGQLYPRTYNQLSPNGRTELDYQISLQTGTPGTYTLVAAGKNSDWMLGNYLSEIAMEIWSKVHERGNQLGKQAFRNCKQPPIKIGGIASMRRNR